MKKFAISKISKIISAMIVGLYFSLSLVLIAEAQTVTQPPIIPPNSTDQQKLYIPHNTDPTTNKTYLENNLLPGIATTIIGIVGGLSLLFVIIGGLQFMTAYANGDAVKQGISTLTWATAGIVIASLSYAIVKIISTINPT